MSFYQRLSAFHDESRSAFILITELLAFVGSMTAILGIGFIRDWFL